MGKILQVVLSSGGVDSTTALGLVVKCFGYENVVSVSVDYGQKHKVELECAEKIAKYYNVKHIVINLADIMKYSNCSLLQNSTQEISHESYSQQIQDSNDGIIQSYVPFRNGLMLSCVASIAMSLINDTDYDIANIILGVHADDVAGSAYADCSEEFTKAMYDAIKIGTYGKVDVVSPFVTCSKADIVDVGLDIKVPYELTHSCYEGQQPCCGLCGTCLDRIDAFKKNKAVDPVPYKIDIDWNN